MTLFQKKYSFFSDLSPSIKYAKIENLGGQIFAKINLGGNIHKIMKVRWWNV